MVVRNDPSPRVSCLADDELHRGAGSHRIDLTQVQQNGYLYFLRSTLQVTGNSILSGLHVLLTDHMTFEIDFLDWILRSS